MMQIRLSPQAEGDLEEIALYLTGESGSIEAAERIIDSILETLDLLGILPYIGRKRDDDLGAGVRSIPVESYLICYRVKGREVQVIRVLHGRRDIQSILAAG
jgi:toxin ParE1/3/4